MKLRTLIIDDEPIALEKLKNYVQKTGFLELVCACDSPSAALDYLSAQNVDVIFTDINMPDLNGLEFVSTLRSKPMVVFITAYPQYAVESYKVSATDYILKPYSFADFQRAANKVFDLAQKSKSAMASVSSSEPLFIKTDYRYIKVNPADIRYIKGYGEYLQIYLVGSDNPLLTLSNFSSILKRLPSQFLQIHRSHIVNMDRAEIVERNRVVMDKDTYLPVSDSYKSAFQEYLSSRSIGKNK